MKTVSSLNFRAAFRPVLLLAALIPRDILRVHAPSPPPAKASGTQIFTVCNFPGGHLFLLLAEHFFFFNDLVRDSKTSGVIKC